MPKIKIVSYNIEFIVFVLRLLSFIVLLFYYFGVICLMLLYMFHVCCVVLVLCLVFAKKEKNK